MKSIASRYSLTFVRALVYMFQSVEYAIPEYLAWYRRTSDFSRVEYRKQLVFTLKAKLLYGAAFGFVLLCVVVGSALVLSGDLLFGVFVILATPWLLPYLVIVPLVALQALQRPYQAYVVHRASVRLSGIQAKKIAITGSYGKTTTREIIKAVLSAGKKVSAPADSINTPIGIAGFIAKLKGDEEVLIFECGEHYPGDVRELGAMIHPDIAIVTGANEAHASRLKSVNRAANTVLEITEFVQGVPLYVNTESAALKQAITVPYTAYGTLMCRGWVAEIAESNLEYVDVVFRNEDRRLRAKSRLIGDHVIPTLLLAVVIADRLGLTDSEIIRGIEATKPYAHRLQPSDRSGVLWIDDSYNGNPDGVRAAIAVLKKARGRRRFFVTPGLVEMGAKSEEVHESIGKVLAEAGIEQVVLMRNSTTAYIQQGLMDGGFKGVLTIYDDALEGLAALPRLTVAGDVVLVQNDWPDQYR